MHSDARPVSSCGELGVSHDLAGTLTRLDFIRFVVITARASLRRLVTPKSMPSIMGGRLVFFAIL